MRFLFTIFSFVSTQILFAQNLIDSIGCLDRPELWLDNEAPIPYDFDKSSGSISSELIVPEERKLSWPWIELGPTYTPPEGKESAALRTSYFNRGNGTGRINDLYINPKNDQQIFACSPTGGLFYSDSEGEKWQGGLTHDLPISGVASVGVYPKNSKIWLIATGDGDDKFMFSDGVYRTLDEGETWAQINGFEEFVLPSAKSSFGFFCSELVIHPTKKKRVFLSTNQGLFLSNNFLKKSGKVSWFKVNSSSFYDLEVSKISPKLVVAGGEKLALSKNRGKTWEYFDPPEIEDTQEYGLIRMSVEFSRSDKNKVYVAVCRKKGLGQGKIGPAFLYSFDIQKKEWLYISDLKKYGNLIPTRAKAFEIHPKTDSLILIGNIKPVRKSEDLGITFSKLPSNQIHDDLHDLEFSLNGKIVYAATDGGVSKSQDAGLTWVPWDDGIGAANVHGLSVSQSEEDAVIYGSYDCGTTLFKDGKWRHVGFGDGFQTIITTQRDSTMLLTMQNGSMFKSEDFGETFNKRVKNKLTKSSWHTWIKANHEIDSIYYHSGNKLSRSMNSGVSWELILDPEQDIGRSGTIWRFYGTHGFPDHLFVTLIEDKKHFVYYTSNANEPDAALVKWKYLYEVPHNKFVEALVKTDDCETCHYLGLNNFSAEKLYYFNGSKLQIQDVVNDASAIRSGIRDKNTGTVYMGCKSGVWSKKPTEEKWTLMTGTPSCRIRSMDINYVSGEIYIGTFGRGVWKAPLR